MQTLAKIDKLIKKKGRNALPATPRAWMQQSMSQEPNIFEAEKPGTTVCSCKWHFHTPSPLPFIINTSVLSRHPVSTHIPFSVCPQLASTRWIPTLKNHWKKFFFPTIRPLYFSRNTLKVSNLKCMSNTLSTAAPNAKKPFRCGYKIKALCKDRFTQDCKVKEKKP